MKLDTKVKFLNKVGGVLEKRLNRLSMETVEDLLFYYPFRYEDFSQMAPIRNLVDGQQVTIRGKIELIGNKRSHRKRKFITEAVVADESGQIKIVWFGQPFIAKTLKVGDEVYFSGKVKSDMFGFQMVSPSYEKATKRETAHTARIIPIYHTTHGITQKQLRFLMRQAMRAVESISEWLPDELQEKADLMPLPEAVRAIHFPDNQDELFYAEKRIKFDELFILQLRAELLRQQIKKSKAVVVQFKKEETKDFVDALSFKLTKDQKVAAWEILQDLEKKIPMNRLLEGDVGSGKTVVATLALNNVALGGYQAVIMAPTEILAKQHYKSLVELLGNKLRVGLVTGSKFEIKGFESEIKTKVGQKREVLEKIKNGEVDVMVGTHALLSAGVEFKDLAFVIVDEQHRFGVEQRKTLKEKSGNPKTTPHFLSMTATPIPRSFALTLYGDLDLSVIKQMPSGRKPVQTRVAYPHNRQSAYQFIRGQVKQGRQVFVVCPLIEDGAGEKKSVMSEYKKLSEEIFPDLMLDYLHGKMKAEVKDGVMNSFAKGESDILVSTSVVEVGVDIPNASVMVIEGAERFGLAQLHQFRGRVGRSSHQSYCFLFADSESQDVKNRLQFFEKNTDGFKIAEYDLERRGPGDVYGKTQSGMMNLRKASLSDVELIKLARDLARGLDFEKYKELKNKVEDWEKGVHLE